MAIRIRASQTVNVPFARRSVSSLTSSIPNSPFSSSPNSKRSVLQKVRNARDRSSTFLKATRVSSPILRCYSSSSKHREASTDNSINSSEYPDDKHVLDKKNDRLDVQSDNSAKGRE